MKGRLTVVLDLDGTLISSYTPKRAPRLPPGYTTYVVGRGGRLNPGGVFVVERPGLACFFSRLAEFAGENPKCKMCSYEKMYFYAVTEGGRGVDSSVSGAKACSLCVVALL